MSGPAAGQLRHQLPLLVWLVLVWILLWGTWSWANVLSGLLVALAVTVLLPLPAVVGGLRVRPLPLLGFLGHFLLDLTLSGAQVAWQALRPGRQRQSAIVRVRLRTDSDLLLTIIPRPCAWSRARSSSTSTGRSAPSPCTCCTSATTTTSSWRRPGCWPRRTAWCAPSARRRRSPPWTGRRTTPVVRRTVDPVSGGMGIVSVIAYALLGGGALLALVRLALGPSLLDRVVATDTLLVIIAAGLAVYAALERDPTVVPVLVVVSLLAFVGSVSIARYVGGMLIRSGAGDGRDPALPPAGEENPR